MHQRGSRLTAYQPSKRRRTESYRTPPPPSYDPIKMMIRTTPGQYWSASLHYPCCGHFGEHSYPFKPTTRDEVHTCQPFKATRIPPAHPIPEPPSHFVHLEPHTLPRSGSSPPISTCQKSRQCHSPRGEKKENITQKTRNQKR